MMWAMHIGNGTQMTCGIDVSTHLAHAHLLVPEWTMIGGEVFSLLIQL